MNRDYQDFKEGDVVTFSQGTPRFHDYVAAKGEVVGIELFFATRIAYLRIRITEVLCGSESVGNVKDIMHLNVDEIH